MGDLTILGHPVGWNGQRNPLRSAAPELGEHNEEVFTALGFTKAEIDDLAKREII